MSRIASITIAAAVAALTVAPAASAFDRKDGPVRVWSAMAGVPTADLLADAQTMPLSDVAVNDQPYCAPDAEISTTLTHDFEESLVDTGGVQGMGTDLWGSDQLGTWTLVATRSDQTSCIIASGVGYSSEKDADDFYAVAGLN